MPMRKVDLENVQAPKGFREQSSTVLKWDTVGSAITLRFLRIDPGQKQGGGILIGEDFDEETGQIGDRIALGCPTVLRSQLQDVKPGQLVHIVYTGEKASPKGSPIKQFVVSIGADK